MTIANNVYALQMDALLKFLQDISLADWCSLFKKAWNRMEDLVKYKTP